MPNTGKSSPLFSELLWDLGQSHVETWNFINSTLFYRFQNDPLEVTGRFAFGKFHKSTNTGYTSGGTINLTTRFCPSSLFTNCLAVEQEGLLLKVC